MTTRLSALIVEEKSSMMIMIYVQWRLGEAYILCKEYEKAIDYFTPLYRKNPDYGDIEHSILSALFALGKSERDFKWVSVPKVKKLNDV